MTRTTEAYPDDKKGRKKQILKKQEKIDKPPKTAKSKPKSKK